MLNVSGLIPEARPVAQEVAAVYLKHTAPWFIGLIAHGSAVKGGVIPSCSDIDFHLYLEDAAFTWHGQPSLQMGFAIRRDLEKINPAPFRYVQCYARPGRSTEDWIGPIPGAYQLIAGKLPMPEATADQLRAAARKGLTELKAPTYIMGSLLGRGGGRLARNVRLLCTDVWPALYQVLTLQQADAVRVWGWPKEQAIDHLPKDSALRETIQKFYEAVWTHYSSGESLESALSALEYGADFIEAVREWYQGSR